MAKHFSIKIDWFVTPAGHGKDLADSMAGTDKHYLAKGYLNWDMRPDRIVDGEVLSEAEKACEFLSHEDRPLHDNRHGDLDPSRKLHGRTYSVANYRDYPIPLDGVQCEIINTHCVYLGRKH